MRRQILLVEDHPVMRNTCLLLINRSDDLDVCAALATAEEALQQAPVLNPSLALVDISLPGMSGIELTERLRAILPSLPILVMTGHGDERYRQDALNAGASGFVFKHEGPVALLTAIRELLNQA